MRWYFVLRRRAWSLKNETLRRERAIVTFTSSLGGPSSSGGGSAAGSMSRTIPYFYTYNNMYLLTDADKI